MSNINLRLIYKLLSFMDFFWVSSSKRTAIKGPMTKASITKFERINVEIINSCNLKCSFCPTPERQLSRMTVGQFTSLAASLAPMTKEVVLHLLGEPLSHPEFAAIITAAAAAKLPVNIVTNGLLLVGDRVPAVLQPIVRQISFSLQSFGNNFPDQDPLGYIKKIKAFTDRAAVERPDLYINLRFWDLEGDGATDTNHNQVLRSTLSKVYGFQWEDVTVNVKRSKSYRLEGRLYLHFDSRFTWPDLGGPVLQNSGFCHGLTGHFGIHADGTVVPCCLDHKADIPLGNVFKDAIEDILSSPRATAMRDGFAKGQLTEDLCRRCGYISRFNKQTKKVDRGTKAKPV